MKKTKHRIHRAIRTAWKYTMKRKLLAVLSAVLLGAAGVAGEQLWTWSVATYKLHQQNALVVPVLVQQVETLQQQVAALNGYTNADYWRWRKQGLENTNLEQAVKRKQRKNR